MPEKKNGTERHTATSAQTRNVMAAVGMPVASVSCATSASAVVSAKPSEARAKWCDSCSGRKESRRR